MEPRTIPIQKDEFLSNLKILKDEYIPHSHEAIGDHLIDYNKITVNDNAVIVDRGRRFLKSLRGMNKIQLDLEDGGKGDTIINSDVNAGTILLLQLIPTLFVFMPTAIFVIAQGNFESLVALLFIGAIIGGIIWWSFRSNQRNINQHIEHIIDEVTLFSKVE